MRHLAGLEHPPDAIFCCNDLLALGMLCAARRLGIRVPDDLAVIGFDDIEDGRYANPTLSTISPDKPTLARTAVRMLVERIRGDRAETEDVVIDFELAQRESTASAGARASAP